MHHVRHRYPDLHIRALTRNPSSSAGQALSKQKNIEVVAADLGDEASLRAAFKVRSRPMSAPFPLLPGGDHHHRQHHYHHQPCNALLPPHAHKNIHTDHPS